MKAPRVAALLVALAVSLMLCASAQAAGGTVVGWGANEGGLIGTGDLSVDPIEAPAAVLGISEATQIAPGPNHALVLLANGTVMAWGENTRGELGDGTTVDRPIPAPVPGLTDVIAVAVAGNASLALRADGTVMAWGTNRFGQMGIGTATGPETCGITSCSRVPVAVPGLSGVVALSGGGGFTLALLSNGTVVSWGSNVTGTTGDGTGSQTGCRCVVRPTLVPGVSGAVAISAGTDHGSALLAGGTVRTWGANTFGELGTGSTVPGSLCKLSRPGHGERSHGR